MAMKRRERFTLRFVRLGITCLVKSLHFVITKFIKDLLIEKEFLF